MSERIDALLNIRGHRMTEWGTPPAFMEWLRFEFDFLPDLDPASSSLNAKAPHFFDGSSEDEDGLLQPWFGNVWVNPPYGNEIPAWIEKCNEEVLRTAVHRILVLVPARCDTAWFHDLVMPHARTVFLIKGRLNFDSPGRAAGANAPFPSMLIEYRTMPIEWREHAEILALDVPKEARGHGSKR